MLKLMYITNNPTIAQIAEASGVDRIFVDLEYIGKADRQGGMDTVQSHHTLDDVKAIADAVKNTEVLVRINPIHNATSEYSSTEDEINTAIANGADILMLPYFKTTGEVVRFLSCVNGRVQTMLLLETPEAVEILDDILALDGIDAIHIGLNDLSLGYGRKFMFELLADGTVERLCAKFRERNIPYGFGGIASLGKGLLPAEMIIKEHYRLGSGCVILSRSFCNVNTIDSLDQIKDIFSTGVRDIRAFEQACSQQINHLAEDKHALEDAVHQIIEG